MPAHPSACCFVCQAWPLALLISRRYDPLRDGPLRYLGYANELGEAFAAWLFPGGVPLRCACVHLRVCVAVGRGCRAKPVHALMGAWAGCAQAASGQAPLLPHPRSYAIAIGYVCFDTYDKWGKTEDDARRKLTTRPIPDSVDLER